MNGPAITDRRTTEGVFTKVTNELTGWDFNETGGANAVTVQLFDGANDSGVPLTPAIKVAAGTSVGREFYHPRNISSGSLFVDIDGTGAAEVLVAGQ